MGSLSFFLANNDVELQSFTVAHAPLDLLRVVHGDRGPVGEDVLASIVAMNETVACLTLNHFTVPATRSFFIVPP